MEGDHSLTWPSPVHSHTSVQSRHICCLNHEGAHSLQKNNQAISVHISAKVSPNHLNSSAKGSADTCTTKNPSKAQVHGTAEAQSPSEVYIFVLKCVTTRKKETGRSRRWTLVYVLKNVAPTIFSPFQSLKLLLQLIGKINSSNFRPLKGSYWNLSQLYSSMRTLFGSVFKGPESVYLCLLASAGACLASWA